ncbi:DUF4058 family protein [Candidatus Viridilinea mediisalina]|uniref:DUF4058 domain-containing protein n=1 Tax=Candidatus Viridilinea mediisalina TaxID=2024553 RepID=A0A2A6RJI4_9CHLR|nr:DUF4058 family protein [Candidatus Viridilinea mediisalina]PDW03237.1 hypothetical protein CJ255_09970 [Candidatus Viridilinea mediisalina]
MELPFPGMNPYLEAAGLWPEVHHHIITQIFAQIQPQITPTYIARITPYVAFERIDLGSARMMELPTRYGCIEIRSLDAGELVTSIEVLSPANKRSGSEGAVSYEKKRQELFKSSANLLEIDLLRAGQRPQLAGPLPEEPYVIFLSRVELRPAVEIWALPLEQALPVVPVPLRMPDPPVPLDLTLALRQIYRNARYDLQIDYQSDPPPPELSAEHAAWVDARLRACGLRG